LQLSSQTFPEGENPEVEYYTKLRNRQLCCKSCVQIPWIYAKMNFEVLSGHQKNSDKVFCFLGGVFENPPLQLKSIDYQN